MKRLTTDNPQDNTEIALNIFYIKDHETWVRGGGPAPDYPDVSLYDYTREIIKTHGLEIDTSSNEAMDEHIAETLFDGIETIEGVVATLYTAAWAFSELRGRLKIFENSGMEPEEIMALIAPPNPPLTLEELREMDGEPVWVDFENEQGEWALVSVSPQSAGVVFLTHKNGIRTPAAIVFECGGNIYRRKPEEGGPC